MNGSMLKATRRAAGWTQALLAEKTKINRVSISNWERGKHKIMPPMAELLRRVFAEAGVALVGVRAKARPVPSRLRRRKVA